MFSPLLPGLLLLAGLRPLILAQDASPPVLTTLQAGPIGAVRATLRGNVVSATSDAVVHFEYGTDAQLVDATSTPEQMVAAAESSLEVSAHVSVAEATTYYFRIVARTDQGMVRGGIVALNTGYSGGTIPESLTETTVEFRGELGSYPTVRTFVEYGKAIDGVTSTVDNNLVNNLEAGTTYYYRYVNYFPVPVMGIVFWQREYGAWQSFVTPGTANPAQTRAAVGVTDITTTTATFHGHVNPAGDATTAGFEYQYSQGAIFDGSFSPDAVLQGVTPEQSVGSGTAWTEITAPAVNLAPGTRIFVWIITRNARGEVRTPLSNGFTTPLGAPTVLNSSALFIRNGEALLTSQVTTGGNSIGQFFEYGTKPDFSDVSHTQQWFFPGRDSVVSPPEGTRADIKNLVEGRTYYFRSVVTSSAGTVRGKAGSFVARGFVAPELSTLPPRQVTPTSAILRVNVEPNQTETTVEFFLDGNSRGMVHLNGGPAVMELPVTGLVPGKLYTVTNRAVNNAGTTNGANSATFVAAFPTPPELEVLMPSPIGTSSATLRASVNPHGSAATVEFVVVGQPLPGYTISRTVSTTTGTERAPIVVEVPVTGLGFLGIQTTFTVTARAFNSEGVVNSGPILFTNLEGAAAPVQIQTKPPMNVSTTGATLRAGVISKLDVAIVSFKLNDILVGQRTVPASANQVIVEWPVTDLFPGTTYSIESTASNFSYSFDGGTISFDTLGMPAPPATLPDRYKFDLVLMANELASHVPAGRLRLNVGRTGVLTGKMTLFGVTYPLRSVVDDSGNVTLRVALLGREVAELSLTLTEGGNDARMLTAQVELLKSGNHYIGAGDEAIGSEAPGGIAPSRYTIILPMRDSTQQGPQGDGFLVGQVSANGRVRMVGKTGDGNALVLTGLLQADLTLPVGLIIGRGTVDYLAGRLDFAANSVGNVTGDLTWTYTRGTGYYTQSFARASQPVGARYVPPKADAPILGNSTERSAVLALFDDVGTSLLRMPLSLDSNGHAFGSQSTKFQLERVTGLFRGSSQPSSANSLKVKFHGVIVPALNRGAGWVEMAGRIGAAELAPN